MRTVLIAKLIHQRETGCLGDCDRCRRVERVFWINAAVHVAFILGVVAWVVLR